MIAAYPGGIQTHPSQIARCVTHLPLSLEASDMVFSAESIALSYDSVPAAKQWWMNTFDCKAVPVPSDWDNPLPSDVALKFPGNDEAAILLSARTEVEQAGFDRSSPVVSVIFCNKLKKAHEQLSGRGILVGPIQDGGDTEFFEIRDTEGNLLQVCKEH